MLGVREGVKPWRMTGWRGARWSFISRRDLRATEAAAGRPIVALGGEDENASVLFVLEQNGKGNVVVGRGPLSAATRTIDAMSDLDADVSMVVLPDEPSPTG